LSNFDQDLDKNPSNFIPLSPITFLERVKDVYPDYEALIYGDRKYTWKQVYERSTQFASSLEKQGIGLGDTVSVLAANTPELFEAHYSVPMTGAVINTINIRLDPHTIAFILDHSDAKLFIMDTQFSPTIKKALELISKKIPIIDIVDNQTKLEEEHERLGKWTYEEFLELGDKNYQWKRPKDEWQAISLSYTSGTTGQPKGVVYHHRGSYLMSMGSVVAWNMPNNLSYLYTVPMFHCNGWGYPWTLALLHAKVIFCRNVIAKDIFNLIGQHNITHFGGAPIVLNLIANAKDKDKKILKNKVYAMTAGAPPPSAILEKMEKLGFEVMHVYGLTETYGHILHCAWNSSWNELSQDKKAEIKSRQGARYPHTEEVAVLNPKTYEYVPMDGEAMGEIMIRGNTVMKGYYKNKETTEETMKNGWFHSGDLAVVHPNGYIQVKDRSKDIIISGGENISSIEVENIIAKHEAVSLVAVVAKQDEKWGETPCAFIELIEGNEVTEENIINYCKENMAGFKRPKHVIFGELPKTSTGKIQKFELRKKTKKI
jgi:fatty-acyl-CoA synthase